MKEKTIALLGQPNSGKSTLFNGLTGSRQHVGNWPGKTVERKDGSFSYKDISYKIVDLPGTYSLSANSDEVNYYAHATFHSAQEEMDRLEAKSEIKVVNTEKTEAAA